MSDMTSDIATEDGDAETVDTETETEIETDAVDTETETEIETDAVDTETEIEIETDAVDTETETDPDTDAVETETDATETDATADEATAEQPEAPAPTSGEATVIDEDDLLGGAAGDGDEVVPLSPYDRPGRWFVVHTQSGYEKKVKQNLEARTASMNMEGRIHEVVIPTREVPEFKNGKKVITEKKLFPGYLLVRCALDDDAWYVIRNTPGVTGFVNQGGKPSPLRRKDVESFLGVEADRSREATKRSKPMFEYDLGETVRVKEGPFADFSGEIIEINEDQLKVKVLVNIFGRETPVELEFAQVARL
jgi:transcriptional antiterminator NusG